MSLYSAEVGGMVAMVEWVGVVGAVMYSVSSCCLSLSIRHGVSNMCGSGTCQMVVSRVCQLRGWAVVWSGGDFSRCWSCEAVNEALERSVEVGIGGEL